VPVTATGGALVVTGAGARVGAVACVGADVCETVALRLRLRLVVFAAFAACAAVARAA
jgi:hypothetical protein